LAAQKLRENLPGILDISVFFLVMTSHDSHLAPYVRRQLTVLLRFVETCRSVLFCVCSGMFQLACWLVLHLGREQWAAVLTSSHRKMSHFYTSF